MTKKWVLAVALLSLAISMGCRNIETVHVSLSDAGNLAVLYVTQTEQFTATVTGVSNTAVTWSLSGTGCSGSGCGTLSPSGLYTAPPGPLSGKVQVTITATSQADSRGSASLQVTVTDLTVQITPDPENVGVGFKQQFTAVVIPDDAPQAVTWTIQNCTGGTCGTIDANGLYSAVGATGGAALSVQAVSSIDPTQVGTASVTVVSSRLIGGFTYPFRFSGFNIAGATARVGNFVVSGNGKAILSGVEDELTSGGPQARTITGGSISMNSNNQGTIMLNSTGTGGSASDTYTMVLDAKGDIQMIESDGNGTGSGVMEPVADPSIFKTSALKGNFVFGFTGADISGRRTGYAGLLPMDGAGGIAGGLLDTSDNGSGTNGTPLNIVAGSSYSMSNGIGTMTLKAANGHTFSFDLYGVSGQTKANNPLTVYAISTDPIATNPAVSGTVVFQAPDSKNNYNNSTFNNTSVASLTGVDSTGTNSNVSLSLFFTDGSGNLAGNFDQNNGGVILSVASFSTGYTYSAAPAGSGRYTFTLLGNPTANPVVPPLPFVLYASAPNQGFLLDQSSPSVMTGNMYLQTAPKGQAGIFAPSNFPGTYAAATTSSGTTLVDPIAANLLLTWVNNETCTKQCVDGTQYDASSSQTVTGAYTMQSAGFGAFTLTAPVASPNFVIYAIDATHVLAMDVTGTAKGGTADASIIYTQQ